MTHKYLIKAAILIFSATVFSKSAMAQVTYQQPKLTKPWMDKTPIIKGKKFASIEAVNSYVNANYKYIPEQIGHDVWKTPSEFHRDGGGDCEDFTIFKKALIVQSGLASEMRVLLLKVRACDPVEKPDCHHVVLEVDGKVLDNKRKIALPIDDKGFNSRYDVIGIALP